VVEKEKMKSFQQICVECGNATNWQEAYELYKYVKLNLEEYPFYQISFMIEHINKKYNFLLDKQFREVLKFTNENLPC
jgi:hypothetical protein